MRAMTWQAGVLGCVGLLAGPAAAQSILGTSFSYQGRLAFKGTPADGKYDLRFTLWEALSGGDNVGSPVCLDEVDLVDGLFSVELDFGNEFGEKARFLGIEVRPGRTPGECFGAGFEELAPRQAILAAPVALSVPGIDGYSLDAVDGSPQSVVFVDAAGEVGVGTTAPDSKLHVRQTGTGVGARVEVLQGNPSPALLVSTQGAGPAARFLGGIELLHQNQTTTFTQSSFQTPGHYTATFGDNLDTQVAKTWAIATEEAFNLDAGSAINLEADSSINLDSSVNTTIAAGAAINLSAGGTFSVTSPSFVVDPSGRLGINSSPGVFHLAVGGLAANLSGTWHVLSDSRLKRNVRPLTGTLAKLMALHGVRFEYRPGAGGLSAKGERTGFIAQEVREVFPEWVSETDEGYLTVGASGFEAMTVEALRELRAEKDAQIAALVKDNDALRARLEELAKRLEAMEGHHSSIAE